MLNHRRHQDTSGYKGDTLIEVMLSIAILSLLVMIGYSVMTRGVAMAYNSLDRTNTQAMIAGQVAALRLAHEQRVTSPLTWSSIVSKSTATTVNGNGCVNGVGNNAFYFTTDPAGELHSPPASSERNDAAGSIVTPGNGLWIEGYTLDSPSPIYTFYIKACTKPVYGDGSKVLRQTKTVVRLYAAP